MGPGKISVALGGAAFRRGVALGGARHSVALGGAAIKNFALGGAGKMIVRAARGPPGAIKVAWVGQVLERYVDMSCCVHAGPVHVLRAAPLLVRVHPW